MIKKLEEITKFQRSRGSQLRIQKILSSIQFFAQRVHKQILQELSTWNEFD
jgi:hypothetical protein